MTFIKKSKILKVGIFTLIATSSFLISLKIYGNNCPPCPPELQGGLVPCGRMCDDPNTKIYECNPCSLCHLFVLVKRIVDFLAKDILFPLAILMIVIGGVMFLTSTGSPERVNTAKRILTSTAIGLAIIFFSWLIVDIIIMVLTPAGSPFENWNDIPCPVCGDGNCEAGETFENCPLDCKPQCSDGKDNDGDGKIDFPDDPDCTNADDNDESGGEIPVCTNLVCQGPQADCKCGSTQTTAANPWCCAASNSVYATQVNCQADSACTPSCGCLCTDCRAVTSPCP